VLMVPVPLAAELAIASDAHVSQPGGLISPGKESSFAARLSQLLAGAGGTEKPDAQLGPATGEKAAESKKLKMQTKKEPEIAQKKSSLSANEGGKTEALASKAALKEHAKAASSVAEENATGAKAAGKKAGFADQDAKDGGIAAANARLHEKEKAPAVSMKTAKSENADAVAALPAAQLPGAAKGEGPSSGLHEAPRQTGKPAHEAGKAVIEVRDYRSHEPVRAAVDGHTRPANGETAGGKVTERVAENARDADGPELRLIRFTADSGNGTAPAAPRTVRADSFAAYLRESFNNQVVRQSGIILRNNNQGEIRLVLKPEHLGRVRLRIQLDDNRLTGRIFVDSALVKESFEQNLSSMYRAFKSSGFEAYGFEVLVDGGEGNNGSSEGPSDGLFRGLPGSSPVLAAKTAQQLDDAVPILEEMGVQSDFVNLVV